jgi:hypothetical protein
MESTARDRTAIPSAITVALAVRPVFGALIGLELEAVAVTVGLFCAAANAAKIATATTQKASSRRTKLSLIPSNYRRFSAEA